MTFYRPIYLLNLSVFALSLFAASCTDAPRKTTTTPSAKIPDSASGEVRAKLADSAARRAIASTPDSPVGDTSKRGAKRAALDSAILIQIATQSKLRTIADSISLVASIRIGLKNPWPVKTPPEPAGAILPQKRIVAFYGNPLS